MKRKLEVVLICLVVILLLATVNINAQEPLVQFDDPSGDDYGPGTYIYPTNEHFAPHQQLFDLLEFRVDQKEGKYRFNFKFGAITNP
ncbi:MAG: glucodextranase DOMON-like domain-containing protein, partial [Bacillota bacterium]